MQTYSDPLLNGKYNLTIVPDPLPGAQWTLLLANQFTHEILFVRWTFVADGTAANRLMGIEFLDVGDQLIKMRNAGATTAGQTTRMYAFQGAAGLTELTNGEYQLALPIRFTIEGNKIIRSSISNIQATDQISEIRITSRRWINQTV